VYSTVRVAATVGGSHPSTSPCDDLDPTSLCWYVDELSSVSRLSCRWSAVKSRGA
jgi:hypothetical protein